MKKSFLTILSMLLLFNLYSQNNEEKIKWQKQSPLSWDDFRAEPDTTNSYSANTNSGIGYSGNYSTSSGKPILQFEVFSSFYPEKSWVKDISDEEYLLAHEQLHFDISELHARKLRKALKNYEIGRTIRQDLEKIYNRVESERVSMQNKFDRETSHSENKTAEMKWRNFIQLELKKLEAFSS